VPVEPSVADYRRAAGQFATGITVVTTALDGVDHAMTASSFASVSLEPLLVLVCSQKDTRFHDAVLATGQWAVSVLDAGSEDAARWFATKGRPLAGQLDRVAHTRGALTGAALLDSSLSHMECRTYATYDGGDHTVVLGEVLWVDVPGPDRNPLMHFRGRYSDPGHLADP
jgi:flavin reductase (DIM6/NTAB) family NADH-FMN oxidoreductase RutF